ncbi:hypothetical protein FPZ12_004145 [Amycolatopsis acidicola]|uniref:Uncharacterized protein n=1 Tax=Amycolatopsis acidicola TaxID=2596893 RepID=A0A5N0VIG6_9PSEU|nr:hypothetical protein [Amycolatopsis acidicola]KAA9166139.1 hypothetical protein FPZ12_004145 [Amycolatopsis acidicola]
METDFPERTGRRSALPLLVATVVAGIVVGTDPDSVVRIARADDPAPQGSLVYGASVGDGCVVGYRKGGGGTQSAAGRLPDGGGLTP